MFAHECQCHGAGSMRSCDVFGFKCVGLAWAVGENICDDNTDDNARR